MRFESIRHTTQGSSAVALPQVRYEILQKHRTPGRGVTVVVHLAAPVDSVQRLARAQKAAVASVALVNDRIAPGRALDHRVQVVDAALRATLPRLGGSIDQAGFGDVGFVAGETKWNLEKRII